MEDRFRLLNPFRYPRQRHERSLQPPEYRRYQDFKPSLQEEFEKKCVYCRILDTFEQEFSVDHYLPQWRYPELVTKYENLFYACIHCNRRKGRRLPTPERFIPNPCDHQMAKHLRFEDEKVMAGSDSGRLAIEVLRLNDEIALFRRRGVLRSLLAALEDETDLLEEVEAFQEMLLEPRSAEETRQLEDDLRELAADLDDLRKELGRVYGPEGGR